MIIPKRLLRACLPEKAFGQEGIKSIYVDVEGKQAWATDGHIMVGCPIVPAEGECSGLVPRAAVELADKQKGDLKGVVFHTEKMTSVLGAGCTFENSTLTFPLEQCQELMHPYGERVLHVNVTLLKQVCDVFDDTKLSIFFMDDEAVLYMENRQGERAIVAQMSLEHEVQTWRMRVRQHVQEEELGAQATYADAESTILRTSA